MSLKKIKKILLFGLALISMLGTFGFVGLVWYIEDRSSCNQFKKILKDPTINSTIRRGLTDYLGMEEYKSHFVPIGNSNFQKIPVRIYSKRFVWFDAFDKVQDFSEAVKNNSWFAIWFESDAEATSSTKLIKAVGIDYGRSLIIYKNVHAGSINGPGVENGILLSETPIVQCNVEYIGGVPIDKDQLL